MNVAGLRARGPMPLVTADELRAARGVVHDLRRAAADLEKLGYPAPALAADLAYLAGLTVRVSVRCLLCHVGQLVATTLDGAGIPSAVLCADCDRRTTQEVTGVTVEAWTKDDLDPAVPCPCRTGNASSPGIHNNQVRAHGRCSCVCH